MPVFKPTSRSIFFFALSVLVCGTGGVVLGEPKEVSDEGFQSLFDGKTLDGWVVPSPVQHWRVNKKDGTLERKAGGGGMLWSEKQYGDFVLELEFRVTPGCNSGVFVRSDPANAVQGGFEIQLMDSHGKEDFGKHDAGALYDAKAADVNAIKPAGQWNTLKIEWVGPRLKVTMNGQSLHDLSIEEWSTAEENPDGSENKFKTALKDLPRVGHIGFQDHGHDVAYRNIRIKEVQSPSDGEGVKD